MHGVLKGHIGSVRSMIAELTDETNVARGFSMPPVAWSIGYMIGFVVSCILSISYSLRSLSPLIGGVLSRPQDRWPHMFSHRLWADYPYFLPCLVAAAFTFFSFVITALYLEEVCCFLPFHEGMLNDVFQTLNSSPSEKLQLGRANADIPQGEAGSIISDLDMTRNGSEKPPPLRSVLTRPVAVSVANHGMLALLTVIVESYTPLVWSTPVKYGGLSLSPTSIGSWLSLYGVMNGIFQLLFFPRFISRFGPRGVFVFSLVSCAVIYSIFPLENLALVAGGGPNIVVWLLIILQLSSLCVFDMGYGMFFPHACMPIQILMRHAGVIYMYIASAAPNRQSLGAAYGLSQVATSVQSVVGPAAAGQLFTYSLTHNVLGGNFAYVVLVGVACVALGVSTQLPRNTWAH